MGEARGQPRPNGNTPEATPRSLDYVLGPVSSSLLLFKFLVDTFKSFDLILHKTCMTVAITIKGLSAHNLLINRLCRI